MGYTFIWILSTRDTYHITHSFAALTRSRYDMCHSLIKPISKCNPCNNLLISDMSAIHNNRLLHGLHFDMGFINE